MKLIKKIWNYMKCPRCGYYAFDGSECMDCGYHR